MENNSVIKVDKMSIPVSPLNGVSSLPNIASVVNVQQRTKSFLDENDEVFVGYGFVNGAFPYLAQNMYGRELEDTQIDTVILENEYLKATFLPTYGGRLWSLFDKTAQKELLYSNSVIRLGNLSTRNAWFAGGVEWNCGVVGHHPFTCSPLFTATLKMDDGTPVLRMYEFERIRASVFQIDFFLPSNSKVLFSRVRIVNPHDTVIPMYWWSNIAVSSIKGGRVIVDANKSYASKEAIVKVDVPFNDGIDITYPENSKNAIDYFWKINQDSRKYVCHVNENGYGLMQSSTNRLRGRKLFVWGQGQGSKKWQEFLSVKDSPNEYCEIQAGLAQTQYECLPMPPKTAWEWIETYGPISLPKEKAHGEWETAKKEVSAELNKIITQEVIEKMLDSTREMAKRKADKLLYTGAGWGALENLRRLHQDEEIICPHLDFGMLGEEQLQWETLLKEKRMPQMDITQAPLSWMLQKEWIELLKTATELDDKENWYTWLQLGVSLFAQNKIFEAKTALEKSLELSKSCWALYALALISNSEKEEFAKLALKSSELNPNDISLAKETMRLLLDAQKYHQAVDFAETLNVEFSLNGRIMLFLAIAHVKVGNFEQAEEIITANGGLSVADIREGETSITELWYEIEKTKVEKLGKEFVASEYTPPANLDFRMTIPQE